MRVRASSKASMSYHQSLDSKGRFTVHHCTTKTTGLVLELLLLRGGGWVYEPELIEWVYPDPDTQPLTARDTIAHSIDELRGLGLVIINDYQRRWRLFG